MEKIEEIISLIDSHEKKESKNVFLRYLKKWPWFVIFFIIGAGLGYFVFKYSPTTYQVTSRILIKNKERVVNSAFEKNTTVTNQNLKIENQIGILQSYTLYNRALSNLDWTTTWYKKEILYNKEFYKNAPFELIVPPGAMNVENVLIEIVPLNDKTYSVAAEGETNQNGTNETFNIETNVRFGEPFANEYFNFTLNNESANVGETYYLNFNNLHSLTSQYLKKTQIQLEDINSDLISISIEGKNPKKDADFINELNKVFIQFGMENETQSSEKSMTFIDSQLDRVKSSLATAQENVSNYRQNNKVMNLGNEAQMVYQKLEEIENDQYLTKLQVDYYNDLLKYLDDSHKIEEMLSPSVIGISDPNLSAMLKNLTDLYRRREVLSYSAKEDNPKVITLEREIKITRDGLE